MQPPAPLAGVTRVGRQIDPGNRLRVRSAGRRQSDAVHHGKGLCQGRPRLAIPDARSRSAGSGRRRARPAGDGFSRLQPDHSAQGGRHPASQPAERGRATDGRGQLRQPRRRRAGGREHRRQRLCPVAPRHDRSGRQDRRAVGRRRGRPGDRRGSGAGRSAAKSRSSIALPSGEKNWRRCSKKNCRSSLRPSLGRETTKFPPARKW